MLQVSQARALYKCPTCHEYDANYAECDELHLMVEHEASTKTKSEIWFLYLGCSNHMVGKRDGRSILMGNSHNLLGWEITQRC